ALAHAGGTTGEWGTALREVFGEFRAPTGVAAAAGGARVGGLAALVARNQQLAGGPPRLLVAKPGLDGHSNGAEQIAVAGRDAGMEVVYQGIRLTPAQIAVAGRDEAVDVGGISILSGSHLELIPEILRLLQEAGVDAPGGGRRGLARARAPRRSLRAHLRARGRERSRGIAPARRLGVGATSTHRRPRRGPR